MSESYMNKLEQARQVANQIKEDLIKAQKAADLDELARIKFRAIPEAEALLDEAEDLMVAQELAKRKITWKAARVNAGLTIAEVSRKLGVDPNTVFRWESDNRVPKSRYLMQLCDMYNISPDWILGIEEEEKNGTDD